MYFFVLKLLYTAFLLYLPEGLSEQDLPPPQNVRIWIEKCTLFLNWSATPATSTCKPHQYAAQIMTNRPKYVESDKLHVSFSPINPSSTYRVRLFVLYKNITISGCHNQSTKYSKAFTKTVSTPNDVTIERELTKRVSETLILPCNLSDAYRDYKVKWYHLKGVNQEVVDTYDMRTLHLKNLTLLNWGRYICEVSYQPCSPNSRISPMVRNTTFITVNVQGPPLILSSAKTMKVSKGNHVLFIIDIISFPKLDNIVNITNPAGDIIYREGIIELDSVEATVNGRKIIMPGYKVNISFQVISTEWRGEKCKVFVSNQFGSSYYRFVLEKETIEISNKVSDEHDFPPPQHVKIWIEKCSLFLKWSVESENFGFTPYKYRAEIKSNTFVNLISVGADRLNISLPAINSSTVYRVRLFALILTKSGHQNNSVIYSKPFTKNVSTHNDVFIESIITRNVSESLNLSCPLNGAYKDSKVKWYHLNFNNQEVIDTYYTKTVQINKLTLFNGGRYICEVTYWPCAPNTSDFTIRRNTTVNVQGPPLILSSTKTINVSEGNNFWFLIDVISFPNLDNVVNITNPTGGFVYGGDIIPEEVEASVNGKKIKLPGYKVNISLEMISAEWLGEECVVILSNEYGNNYYRFIIEEETKETAKETFNIVTFLRKNNTLLSVVGGVVVVLLITLTVTKVICSNYKKKNKYDFDNSTYTDRNSNHAHRNRPGTNNAVYEYARPESFINGMQMEDIREQEILEERKQIASLYSYGGFSLAEFEEDGNIYHNQYAPDFQ